MSDLLLIGECPKCGMDPDCTHRVEIAGRLYPKRTLFFYVMCQCGFEADALDIMEAHEADCPLKSVSGGHR